MSVRRPAGCSNVLLIQNCDVVTSSPLNKIQFITLSAIFSRNRFYDISSYVMSSFFTSPQPEFSMRYVLLHIVDFSEICVSVIQKTWKISVDPSDNPITDRESKMTKMN